MANVTGSGRKSDERNGNSRLRPDACNESGVSRSAQRHSPSPAVLGSFLVIALLFAAMFRYLPDARISWRDVRAGALGTALLFVLGRTLIGLYLGRADPGSVYGAAGSLALVLIWVYYTSMILLLGAEFTKLWAQRYGKGIVPVKGAVAYVEEERKVREG